MKKHYSFLLLMLFCISAFAQHNVNINVTDAISGLGIDIADVTFDSTTLQTDVNGDVSFTNIADGTYNYSISKDCYESTSGSITVSGANANENYTLTELTTANVFWNVNQDSSPVSFPVATADISMTDGTNTYTLAYDSNNFMDVMADVAFGTYNYTISTDCHEDVTGTVTVDCANIDPNNPTPTVAVWEVQGAELTTANVFWNVNQDSSPVSFPVATADISMTDGTNTYTLAYDSNNFMDVMADVAFGTYNYTISTDCHEDVTGTVTVDCANIDPNNPTPTVAVWEVQGAELTTANVFWNVNQDSSPVSFPVATADISMTDGTNTYTLAYDSNNFMDVMADVAFGTYNYTISTDCHEDVTGTVTVDCANIDPNNPTPTVAVWEVQGAELTTANVFWNVNQDSSPVSFPVATADISMTDGTNTYTLAYDSNNFMDVMADVAFGTYNYTISTDCHEDVTGTVTVDCANIDPNNPTPTVAVWEVQGAELTTANVFWNVNQDSSPVSFPVATADISMTDGTNTYTLAYDSNNFMDVMADVAFGTYNYTISTDCHEDVTGTVTVDCANIDPNNPTPTVAVWEVQGAELTTANVFWNVNQDSSPVSFPVATADISMTDGTNTYTLAYDSNNFMDVMADVAFGTYNYTISTDCHEDVTGTVTVDCANIDPNNPTPTVAVWEVQGAELTTANVFWNVNQDSSPVSFPVATADISMTDGTNTYTLAYDSNNFMDVMADVAFGTYNYTISTDCHEDVTGTVTVDCANIDPNNPTPTVAVWEVQGAELTTANVFWNVNQDSSPVSFPVATADISMTDGTNTYTLAYDSNNFMDVMADVAFGTYNYTISTDCHEDVTGTVTVDCANIDPNNPTPTVAVWEVQGAEITLDATVTQNNEMLTANENGSGVTYQWIDCDNGNAPISGETNQSFTATSNGSYAVIITNTSCSISETSSCYDVNTLSIDDSLNSPIELKLYPNPVVDDLTIKLNDSFNKIETQVFSIDGKLVKTIDTTNEMEFKINMSDLPLGTYLVKINADGKTNSTIVIKK